MVVFTVQVCKTTFKTWNLGESCENIMVFSTLDVRNFLYRYGMLFDKIPLKTLSYENKINYMVAIYFIPACIVYDAGWN